MRGDRMSGDPLVLYQLSRDFPSGASASPPENKTWLMPTEKQSTFPDSSQALSVSHFAGDDPETRGD